MSLPVNINELINGITVEWERIEFKEGWNAVEVLHAICAFANDINNWGGGYVIIGIKEKDGRALLPPVGLSDDKIDAIQKELLNLCNRLKPHYFPIAEPVLFQKKKILAIWVPGGQNRPYRAPVTLVKKSDYAYYIRRYSSTVKAQFDDEKEIISLAGTVPFDDRITHTAEIHDLKLSLIRSFLREVNSDLYKTAADIPFEQLCRQMAIVARRYRNRRIGEFFKELKMTEGRCTGIPRILEAIKNNGSPPPIFKTDDERTYFIAVLEIHPDTRQGVEVTNQVTNQVTKQGLQILEFCKTPRKKKEILGHLGLSNQYINYKKHIIPLVEWGLLSMTIPGNPNHPDQRYLTTESGLKVINHKDNSTVSDS
jgi:predicted HTH transcriptional regulator